MDSKEYLDKLHKEILLVMDEIDRVCAENNLTYYLVGGSLLGAVRHKGFIPWDDDLDIAMPREDFEKFVNIYHKKLKAPFALKWDTTEQDYWMPFAKVENKDTVFGEEIWVANNCPFGIFVDIFPLDTTPAYTKKMEFRKNFIMKIVLCRHIKKFPKNHSWLERIAVCCVSNKLLGYMYKKLAVHDTDGEYYTSFASQYNIKKQNIRRESYGTSHKIQFEDRFYNAPVDEIAVLEKIYGSKFMEIPPIEKRRIHYPIVIKFSDGQTITFEPNKNKVRVE